MRRLLLTSALLAATVAGISTAQAGGRGSSYGYDGGSYGSGGSVYVRPHVRGDGGYVAPHHRSAPNGSAYDNYGSRGNVNPYTGARGSRNPW